jgi:hypothetical protein
MDIRSPLVAHQEPAVPREPRQRTLHLPPVPPQSLADIFPPPCDAALDAASSERPTASGKVVDLVGVQLLGSLARPAPAGTLDRPDSVYQLLEDLGVVHVGGGEHHGEGHAVAVGQEVVLRAGLTPVGGVGADRFTPPFGGYRISPANRGFLGRARQDSNLRPSDS